MYGPTTAALLREGAIAGLWDFRSGHALDFSGNGNHGTMSAGMKQIGPAGPWVFPAATDEVTVADAASLRLTAGSIVAYSEYGFTRQINYETVYAKGLVETHLRIGSDRIQMYDGVSYPRFLTTGLSGKRSLGVSFSHGAIPNVYLDGLLAGAMNANVSIVPRVAVANIGNCNNAYPLKFPLSAVLLANRILTDIEMAAVYAELLAARWPSKQLSVGKRVQGSAIGEANLLAGFTLRPSGLSVPSHDGAYTGTLSGQAQHVNSILGDALSLGRTTGAVDLGVGNAQINPTTDSHWVEVWARPLDVAMSDARVPIIGKPPVGNSYFLNFGLMHSSAAFNLEWYESAPIVGYKYVTPAVTPQNASTHFLYQVDRVTNKAYLYINGVQYGPTVIGTPIAPAAATNWTVGKNGSTAAAFDEGFGGLVCNPRIGTGVLTPAQVQARYLEGAKAVQFKTDWGYPISPADEGGVTGQQIGGHASPFRAGDATGRWAVETDTIDGKVHKVINCKTAGLLHLDGSYFHQATATERAFGSFRAKMYKTDAGVITWKLIGTDFNVAANGYAFVWAADESVVLSELGVGNVVAGGTASHSVWHDFDATRALTGLFTSYVDRASFGTGTDITTLTSVGMAWDMDAGCKLDLGPTGGGGIVKLLGVVAP